MIYPVSHCVVFIECVAPYLKVIEFCSIDTWMEVC